MFTKTKALISISLLVLLSLTCADDTTCPVVFSEKCFEGLGCFYTGPPYYDPTFRPINLAPSDPEEINTRFLLYTRAEKDNSYDLELTQESLAASNFDEEHPTKILIHGFLKLLEMGDIIYKQKDAMLEDGDYNVILVDWTAGDKYPYEQAAANTRVVGAQVAQLIEFLQSTVGIGPKSVHLLAHDLGVHVSGYAGERLQNLGRITGLDPAGPLFTGTDIKVRLDPSDADFVDVIHTNIGGDLFTGGFGLPDPIGHLDFYPNGGIKQPSCKLSVLANQIESDESLRLLSEATSCDHIAALYYLLESIKPGSCTFVGTKCESYDVYKAGGCDNNLKAVMGFSAQKIPDVEPGKEFFYLDTNETPPYCIQENSP